MAKIDFAYVMPTGINAGMSTREVFYSKIDKSPDDCWHWMGKKFRNGYGCFTYKGRYLLAHRVSFELHNKETVDGLIMHSCDNKMCVNPEHLSCGTHKDNYGDMRRKGRENIPLGINTGRGVLTEHDILTIRARRLAGEMCKEIAKDYSVRPNQISRIITGARHAHVSEKNKMTPQEYVKLAMRTNTDMGRKSNVIHSALLLGSEAGEVISEVKRFFAYGKELDTSHIKEELGDIMWGVALMCHALGFDLEDVMRTNIAKLEARYPDLKFDAERSLNRDLIAEKEAMERAVQ